MSAIRAILASLLTSDDPGIWSPLGGMSGGVPGVFANYPTSSGEVINERTALLISTHFACIRCKSEDLAKLPCVIAETIEDDEREIRKDDPAYRILNVEYNPEMDCQTGAETLFAHAIGFKHGVCEIERDGAGNPVALWPLDPTRVVKKRVGGRIMHEYRRDSGQPVLIPDADMFEIIGPSYDGLVGYSMAEITKYTLGLAMAASKFQGSFFGNGAFLGGVIDELPGPMNVEQIELLRQSFNARHQGAGKAFGVGIIPRGKFHEIGINPEEGQVLPILDYTVVDICRFHRVPPPKVQALEQAHYNNVESLNIAYVSDALMPLGRKYELEIKRKLLTGERYARINYNGLLRADYKTRMEGYAIGRMWGIYTINDVLKREDENVTDDPSGDMRLVPANMVPADKADQPRNQEQTNNPPPQKKPDQNALREAHLPLVVDGLDRAVQKERKRIAYLRQKDRNGDVNAFYEEHKLYVASCVVPALRAMASLAGSLAANEERLRVVTELFATEYVNARPAAEAEPSREWVGSLAKRWIDATLAAVTEE